MRMIKDTSALLLSVTQYQCQKCIITIKSPLAMMIGFSNKGNALVKELNLNVKDTHQAFSLRMATTYEERWYPEADAIIRHVPD